MSKKPETKFKEEVAKKLRTLDKVWFEKIQQVAKSGTPDFLCCVRGQFVAIELKKSSDEEPMHLQMYKLMKIAEAGGFGMVISPENWDECFDLLTKLSMGIDISEEHFIDLKEMN